MNLTELTTKLNTYENALIENEKTDPLLRVVDVKAIEKEIASLKAEISSVLEDMHIQEEKAAALKKAELEALNGIYEESKRLIKTIEDFRYSATNQGVVAKCDAIVTSMKREIRC